METTSSHMYLLKGLPRDEIWSIIKHEVLGNDGESLSPELETIGRAIAERCGGVPLAAKVVGGILRDKKVENWSLLKEDKVWGEVEKSKKIMPVLRLSFDRLPSALKQCFAYCSLFPKDFEFEKEILIEMWMAEGFLETSMNREGEEKAMEEVGDEYFHHLLANSFFQDVKKDERGNVSGWKMHDLFHDLAMSVSALETCVLNDGSDQLASSDFHRLSLLSRNEQVLSIQGVSEFLKDGARKLRSFFSTFDVFPISANFKSLRTLNLKYLHFRALPASIGKLKHLRFIDISWNNDIEELPSSIRKLYNLQTLRLIGCWKLKKLPKEMRKLVSLRHIYFDEEMLIMPAGVGCWTNLQTLPSFIVGLEKGYKILELGGLKELKGELKIQRLELVPNGEEAKRAKLKDKTKLFKLSLEWNCREDDSSSSSSNNDEQVLKGLQPPPSVQRLKILNYMGKKIVSCQSWMLSELVELKLVDCKRCEVIPTLGHLAHLEVIEIKGMTNLKSIGIEFYGNKSSNSNSNGGPPFPALKEFTLNIMDNLVEWIGPTTPTPLVLAFPCLEVLGIYDCPCLPSIPIVSNLTSLGRLIIMDCTNLESLPSVEDLVSLKELGIERCQKLTSHPEGLHLCNSLTILSIWQCDELTRVGDDLIGSTSLQKLVIVRCPKLTSLPMKLLLLLCPSLEQILIIGCDELAYLNAGLNESDPLNEGIQHLTTIETLYVYGCPRLIFPDDILGYLTQLKELRIGGFWEELEEFPGLKSINQLSGSLKELTIYGWDRLKTLPHQLQHLTSLVLLRIWGFNGVEALPEWLCNLSSLQQLHIHDCRILKSLPIATAMQRLSKLEFLYIQDCPLLEERCVKDNGPEWSKISHIHSIYIDHERIK